MANSKNTLAAHAIRVKSIDIELLRPNPHNPRLLFDRIPMETLKESISKVGILVPLTVYEDSKSKKYIILDGQRRWICAKEIGIKKIPVNEVAEPSLVQNIVTMFQIHKLREDWELMPTALKVEVLMEELKERESSKLSKLTGLDESVITRCKKLLSYNRKYQDMMLDVNPEDRIKADFFIEMYQVVHDREVMKFKWFDERSFIEQMLKKYREDPKTIKAVTDFRIIKQYISKAKQAGVLSKFSQRLKEFVEKRDLELAHLEITEVSQHTEAKSVIGKMTSLYTIMKDLNTELFYGEEELWKQVSQLISILQQKLKEADKRQ
jgi:ParB family transcriptional regulator, chromosome partitioning protein